MGHLEVAKSGSEWAFCKTLTGPETSIQSRLPTNMVVLSTLRRPTLAAIEHGEHSVDKISHRSVGGTTTTQMDALDLDSVIEPLKSIIYYKGNPT